MNETVPSQSETTAVWTVFHVQRSLLQLELPKEESLYNLQAIPHPLWHLITLHWTTWHREHATVYYEVRPVVRHRATVLQEIKGTLSVMGLN